MNKLFNLILRYLLIVLFGLGNLYIFYLIFTPLTTNLVYLVLNIFSNPTISGTVITLSDSIIQIIPACVAGSAYYLLLVLTLSTPNLSLKDYFKLVATSFGLFFSINVLRIMFLILIRKSLHFELIHQIFWYAISTIFVVLIWFYLVKKYKIKDYPILSDLKYLLKLSKKAKKAKRTK